MRPAIGAWRRSGRSLPHRRPREVERRGRERITLELTGLCLGLIERPPGTPRPRLPQPEALQELARHPSVIAHEVANPLNAALLSVEVCLESVRDAEPLDEAFRAQLSEELLGVVEAINRAVEFLRSIQDRARGTLAWDTAQQSVFLLGDPNALYQILTNLIHNAVDAAQDRQGFVEVGLEQMGPMLQLAVRDRGAGIASQHLERIFEPGFTTKPFGTSSGMGLTVVRELIEKMFGGTISVDSALGEGSTFTVALPIPPQRSG